MSALTFFSITTPLNGVPEPTMAVATKTVTVTVAGVSETATATATAATKWQADELAGAKAEAQALEQMVRPVSNQPAFGVALAPGAEQGGITWTGRAGTRLLLNLPLPAGAATPGGPMLVFLNGQQVGTADFSSNALGVSCAVEVDGTLYYHGTNNAPLTFQRTNASLS